MFSRVRPRVQFVLHHNSWGGLGVKVGTSLPQKLLTVEFQCSITDLSCRIGNTCVNIPLVLVQRGTAAQRGSVCAGNENQ